MILFSTLPHQRATPLLPAGTIAKEPHEIMKRIKRTIRIKMVRGFGPLKSNVSNDLSDIVHLLWVLSMIEQQVNLCPTLASPIRIADSSRIIFFEKA
jgi:hypothetical protein